MQPRKDDVSLLVDDFSELGSSYILIGEIERRSKNKGSKDRRDRKQGSTKVNPRPKLGRNHLKSSMTGPGDVGCQPHPHLLPGEGRYIPLISFSPNIFAKSPTSISSACRIRMDRGWKFHTLTE